MAYRDYILCKTCGCKIVYDGDDNGRNMLETYWGKPFAPDWTVGLLCPDCIAQMEAENERLRADAERYRHVIAHARRIVICGVELERTNMDQLSARIDAAREAK